MICLRIFNGFEGGSDFWRDNHRHILGLIEILLIRGIALVMVMTSMTRKVIHDNRLMQPKCGPYWRRKKDIPSSYQCWPQIYFFST